MLQLLLIGLLLCSSTAFAQITPVCDKVFTVQPGRLEVSLNALVERGHFWKKEPLLQPLAARLGQLKWSSTSRKIMLDSDRWCQYGAWVGVHCYEPENLHFVYLSGNPSIPSFPKVGTGPGHFAMAIRQRVLAAGILDLLVKKGFVPTQWLEEFDLGILKKSIHRTSDYIIKAYPEGDALTLSFSQASEQSTMAWIEPAIAVIEAIKVQDR